MNRHSFATPQEGVFSRILAAHSIWFFAFGYFACYIPYSFLAKILSDGSYGQELGVRMSGFSLLPLSVAASTVGMLVFLTVMRWWRFSNHSTVLGIRVPHPTVWTFLSGLCTGLVICTTTLAYTFEGISIVFAMLLMRGGVLVIAPTVDALSGRRVNWYSWAALGCAMAAVLVGAGDTKSYSMTLIAALNIVVYLTAYFIRLRFMSRLAKAESGDTNRRYFVEEQMVAGPVLLLGLILAAVFGGGGQVVADLRAGFFDFWGTPLVGALIVVGLFSQGTGIFGSLIFLDKRENSFCVPVNRSSSVLAGVIASFLVASYSGKASPAGSQLLGAAAIILAILFLSIPPMLQQRRSAAQRQRPV